MVYNFKYRANFNTIYHVWKLCKNRNRLKIFRKFNITSAKCALEGSFRLKNVLMTFTLNGVFRLYI